MNDDKQNKEPNENEDKDPFSDEEEFKKMLNSIIESQTGKKGNTKIVIFSNRIFKNIFLDFFFIFILNFFLFLGMEGLFKIYQYDNMIHYLIYISAFTVIEYLIKNLMFKLTPSLILKSLGTINLLITTISISISLYGSYLLFNMGIESTLEFIITLIIILILRSIVCSRVRVQNLKR